MENGYSICLNEWALDKKIKNELGLLCIISSLCAEKGYCYASNKYFSELFGLPEQTISRKIKLLEEKKYITIEYNKRGCEVIARYLRLTKMLIHDKQKCESTINKNVKDNNISNNIISNKKDSSSDFLEMVEQEFLNITPLQYEMLISLEDQYGTNNCINALKECAKNNVKNINYLRAVLKNINNTKKDIIKPEWLDKEIEKDDWRLSDEDRQKLGI